MRIQHVSTSEPSLSEASFHEQAAFLPKRIKQCLKPPRVYRTRIKATS